MQHEINLIDEGNFKFDNLPDRPVKPTNAEIANAMTPLPPLVRNGFFVGQVITMSGNQAPQGTLACDGTVYNIADYPDLANYYATSQGSANFYGGDGETTFAVPDLRGEFLRGCGTNSHSGEGNGSNVGTHQDATRLLNSSINTNNGTVNIQYVKTSREAYTYPTNGDNYLTNRDTVGLVTPNSTISTGGTSVYVTTRPTNTSVLYCVVY